MTQPLIPPVFGLLQHSERRSYPAKEIIFAPGMPADTLYYIVQGQASISIKDPRGHEIVLAYLGAGDFLGETGLFLQQERRQAWACARQPCELAEIGYARLRELAARELATQYAELLFALAAQMAARLRRANHKISDLAFLAASGRIMNALSDLSQADDTLPHPLGRQVCLTRQELGRVAGCSREMAGRMLKHLQEQGMIRVEGRKVIVLEREERVGAAVAAEMVFSLV